MLKFNSHQMCQYIGLPSAIIISLSTQNSDSSTCSLAERLPRLPSATLATDDRAPVAPTAAATIATAIVSRPSIDRVNRSLITCSAK